MRRRLAPLLVGLLVAGVGCASDDAGGETSTAAPTSASEAETTSTTATTSTTDAPTTTTERPRPTSMAVTLTDGTRPTLGADGAEISPSRRLPTTIHLPDHGDGPFPLIVHAHGNEGSPEKFRNLLRHWADAGFVVAAPELPLTHEGYPGGTVVGDYVNQPADMSFVIDEVLALSDDPDSPLHGLVDESRIGASGLSLGGATVHALGFHTCCIDERVDAIEMLAGFRLGFPTGEYTRNDVPLLIAHGTSDPIFAYDAARQTFDEASSPVVLATLEGAGHAEAFEDPDDAHDALVRTVTTRFWQAYLLGNEKAEARLTDSDDPALMRIETR